MNQTLSPIRIGRKITRAHVRDYGVLVILVALFVALSFSAENFLTTRNLMNILDQNAPMMLIALGTTFVIITGAFDLSSGQIMSLTIVLCTQFTYLFSNPVLGILLAVLVSIPIGAFNGFIISRFKINSFLTTLASSLIISGIALYATAGQLIDLSANNTFTFVGTTRLGDVVPISVVICLVVFAVFTVILRYTKIGRHIYALGANKEAARLSGISEVRIRTLVYVLGAFAAALAGMILSSRTGVGRVLSSADAMTLNAIAAVVIGGTSIAGGRGAMWRTVVGVLLLALLQNAFNMMGVPPYWQTIVTGSVILLAVLANATAGQKE
jgi:ribose transport system permease protein